MKYRNKTDIVIRFRATNKKGEKELFILKPKQTMESDLILNNPQLELVEEKEKKEKIKEEN